MTRSAHTAGLIVVWLLTLLVPSVTQAGFTETVPKHTFIVDEAFVLSWVHGAWDDGSHRASLVDAIEMYEPGGPLQGILTPDPHVRQMVLINQLQYGITDGLTVALGIPVVLRSEVDPRFGWTPGEYQSRLGRVYSVQDFWDWAAGMGQAKPGTFDGNHGVLSDLVVGLRWRFSDHLPWLGEHGLALSLLAFGILPTGRAADPDEVISVGTTLWDLYAQGDLGVHLGVDKTFERELDGRLALGLDAFYEAFFERTRRAPNGGTENKLLLNQAPYVGDTYRVKPGDWSGAACQVSMVPWNGPSRGSWLTGGDDGKAARMPPLVTLSVGYRFLHMQQTDWSSRAPHWDWKREEDKRPGWRHTLSARASFSFLRLGAPVQVYVTYSNSSWLPGKNTVAPDMLSTGIQVPLKFW